MKFPLLFLATILAFSVFAQTAPAPQTPAGAVNPSGAPRPAAADLPPDTVVAAAGTQKLTIADLEEVLAAIPPQMRQNYYRDPQNFLSQWFMLKKISALAESEKLDQKSPYKEGIAIQRMTLLMQALVNERTAQTVVSEEDQKKAYEQKKDDYSMAKVKIIYVPFAAGAAAQATDGGKKSMTEAEALAKAEGLVKEARAGKDFVALVKANSEDPISKERDGDFGPIRKGDKLPEEIKQTVFGLKPGDISDPVRQPNGYYVFRLSEFSAQPFAEVQESLFNELKNQRMKEWMEGVAKSTQIKVEKPEYFDQVKQSQR
jgi:parvulin-like peptidyl-prolyl isomerase